MDYVVTVSICEQVGPEDYEMRKKSKVVNSLTTIGEIELWMKKEKASNNFAHASISSVST